MEQQLATSGRAEHQGMRLQIFQELRRLPMIPRCYRQRQPIVDRCFQL